MSTQDVTRRLTRDYIRAGTSGEKYHAIDPLRPRVAEGGSMRTLCSRDAWPEEDDSTFDPDARDACSQCAGNAYYRESDTYRDRLPSLLKAWGESTAPVAPQVIAVIEAEMDRLGVAR